MMIMKFLAVLAYATPDMGPGSFRVVSVDIETSGRRPTLKNIREVEASIATRRGLPVGSAVLTNLIELAD